MLRLLTNPRLIVTLAIVGGLLAVALWPKAVAVETAALTRGPLVVTIDEEGETRVRERFVVSAPVSGRLLRIELEPGDAVKRAAIVARLQPGASPLLDARTRADADAAVDSARAALGRARAEEQRLNATLAQARRELARVRELADNGLATGQQIDTAEANARVASDAVEAAAFAVRAAESELRRSEVRAAPAPAAPAAGVTTVVAPVDGVVLRRLHESEAFVQAGEPLVEIGDPSALEIVSDLLSTDAVNVRPGSRAIVDQWGGSHPLDATVRRVEPGGFTKVSALGVEEQRVNVILDFASPADAFASLGDAYRVEVRIVTWESPDVLKIPTSALFRQGENWAAYIIVAGRARLSPVMLGHRTGTEAEVLGGLNAGDTVILHPGDTVVDGIRVTPQ